MVWAVQQTEEWSVVLQVEAHAAQQVEQRAALQVEARAALPAAEWNVKRGATEEDVDMQFEVWAESRGSQEKVEPGWTV